MAPEKGEEAGVGERVWGREKERGMGSRRTGSVTERAEAIARLIGKGAGCDTRSWR